jgi:hypothetical protein
MSGRTTYGLFGKNIKKNTDTSYIKSISINKIKYHYENGDLILPDFQRELNKEKIDEMKINMKSQNKLILFSSMVNPIQLATIKISENKFKHLVIDGQHRLMALVALNKKMDDICFEFHIIICHNEKEAIKQFKSCIKGQENNYLISKEILNEHFRESIPYRFYNYLKEDYEIYFSKSTNDKSYYKMEVFLLELKEKEFFTMSNSFSTLKKYFEKKNEEFYNKEYSSLINRGLTDLFYKKELIALENKVIFSLKNSNFIDYLIDNENETNVKHKYKKVKAKIPQKLRLKTWNNFSKNDSSKCPISFCEEIISINNFDCGHMTSEFNGGMIELNNLIPLCKNCNVTMGTNNITQFDVNFNRFGQTTKMYDNSTSCVSQN